MIHNYFKNLPKTFSRWTFAIPVQLIYDSVPFLLLSRARNHSLFLFVCDINPFDEWFAVMWYLCYKWNVLNLLLANCLSNKFLSWAYFFAFITKNQSKVRHLLLLFFMLKFSFSFVVSCSYHLPLMWSFHQNSDEFKERNSTRAKKTHTIFVTCCKFHTVKRRKQNRRALLFSPFSHIARPQNTSNCRLFSLVL